MSEPISDSDLHAYVDGELPDDRRHAVEAHLVANPDAAELLALWAAQREAIRAAYDPVMAEPVPPGLIAAARRGRGAGRWRLAAAAAIVIAFAGGVGAGRISAGLDRPDLLARAGLTAHRLYIPEKIHPVEVTADNRPHLDQWLSRRVGSPVAPPDLTASGLTLLGGRVAPVGTAAGALFMYENAGGERFTLLIARVGERDRPLAYHEAGDFGAYDWSEGGYGFVLAGPHDEARLESLQRDVEANWL